MQPLPCDGVGGQESLRERYRTFRQDCLVPVPGSFQWERRDIRSAGERIRQQNGFKDMGGWRKERSCPLLLAEKREAEN